MKKLLVALFLSTAAFANPQVTTVSPASATTSGGAEITITGAGFTADAQVQFGSTPATETHFVNATTLVAVTPAHLPGVSHVEVRQADGNAFHTFAFVGPIPSTFERVLLPTFTGPVNGAFGSVFETELRAKNGGGDPVHLYGLALDCRVTCIGGSIDYPPVLTNDSDIKPHDVLYTGTPAQFLMVPKSEVDRLSANLRVFDTTRTDANFGTEIPIVRQRDFFDQRDSITLLGVPTDPQFRNTLRVYSYDVASQVVITLEGHEPWIVPMQGARNIFEPAYAVFTDFPTGVDVVDVNVSLFQPNISADIRQPFWAFVTVTNNETQLISTISPQP